MMRGQVSGYGFYCFRVDSCGSAYNFEVVFVGEVEEEDVVCLAVDALFHGVWLVCDEGGEYAEVAHAGDDVIPVSLAEVEVCFFGEEEDGFQLPVLQAVDEFTEDVFYYYLAVDGRRVFEVYDDCAAVFFSFQQALFKKSSFGYVVCEEARVYERVETG